MSAPSITYEARRTLVETPVTLDGEPAVLRGARNDLATVARLDGKSTAAFSWPAAARVVAAGGAFTS